jgi:iron complex outermembrane receptor protein
MLRLFLLAVLLLSAFSECFAQTSSSLYGTVTDSSGAVVAGARVEATRGFTAQFTDADADGKFRIDNLTPGRYRLTATRQGFAVHASDVNIQAGSNPELTIRLDAASVVETLTVSDVVDAYDAQTSTTATRLELPLIEVPQSVGVVTRKLMEDRQVLRLHETADNVSGVRPSPGYGGLSSNNYYIRGFRGVFAGGSFRNGFRDYTFLSARDVANVDRVEFLKGPSSVMYGQSEVGGVVNTITKQPLPDHMRSLTMTTGSFGLARPTLDFTGPLNRSKSLLYRANFAFERSDGYRDLHRSESYFLAPALTWRATSATTVRFEAEMQRYDYLFDVGLPAEPEFLLVPTSRFYGEPVNNSLNRQINLILDVTHRFGENWSVRSGWNALVNHADPIYVSPSGLAADRRTVNRVAWDSEEISQNYSTQNELYGRFDTGSIRHNFVGGTELARYHFGYSFLGSAAAPIDLLNPVYGRTNLSFAPSFGTDDKGRLLGIYLQDQITIGKYFRALASMRGDFVDLRSFNRFSGVRANSRSFFNLTPRAGLVFMPRTSTSLYFSYAESFLPQFGISRTGERFDPLAGRQYEAGWKQNLFRDRVFATIAAYRIFRRNVLTPDVADPRFSIQTGEQQSKGIEFDLAGRLTRTVNLVVNYSAVDAYVSFDNRLLVGSKVVGLPKHSFGTMGTWEPDRGMFRGLSLGAGVYAFGARHTRLPNTSVLLDPYSRTDFMLGYRRPRWKVQANLKNAFDSRYYENGGFNIVPQAPVHAVVSLATYF